MTGLLLSLARSREREKDYDAFIVVSVLLVLDSSILGAPHIETKLLQNMQVMHPY
jgi:hypothetical protein